MLGKNTGDKLSLGLWWDARKPDQDNAGVKQALAENKVTKILIGGQQNGIVDATLEKHRFIVDSGIEFSDGIHHMPIGAKAFDDLCVYIFVRDDIQLTFSNG